MDLNKAPCELGELNELRLLARAKINLYLDVTGKRPDGYHTIKSVMQTIALHDIVTLTQNNSGAVTLSCSAQLIASDESNIAHKAARAFFSALPPEAHVGAGSLSRLGALGGLHIHIEKKIPAQAGLGGGSADGAAVLNGLNAMHNDIFSLTKLCEIGATVGADVPFCITGGTCLCEGSGEKLSILPPLAHCFIVVAKGKDGISTKEAYEAIDRMGQECRAPASAELCMNAFSGNIDEAAAACFNIFEMVTELPDVFEIKNIMKNGGALHAQMSGSGSAVFGIFTDVDIAGACCGMLRGRGFWAEVSEVVCGAHGADCLWGGFLE
ncbi:MAG: 4-(cytidine 5'-diphospho)-2-C-methyl-D-erythritol kinase [Oscillospiraceae bacterium]|nr:4-(cytidine 5'-diphospho)-2-C-methyl-D-erythritol kinase [Oscillospiraceae bacterium]